MRIIKWIAISSVAFIATLIAALFLLRNSAFFMMAFIMPFIIPALIYIRAENIIRHEWRMIKKRENNKNNGANEAPLFFY